MNLLLDESYWSDRYQSQQTGWDIGYASTPLKTYIDQLTSKNQRILIPGCGRGYEGEYLFQSGFHQVYQMDLSALALQEFSKRVPEFPEHQLLKENFFEHEGQYDLILEQTFFCAIDPELRPKYVQSAASKLVKGGKIAGLLFQIPLFTDHPPFGGSKEEYMALFQDFFHIRTMEEAHNSIPPRAGSELFIILEKK